MLGCSRADAGLDDPERGRFVAAPASTAASNAEGDGRRTVVRGAELTRETLAAAASSQAAPDEGAAPAASAAASAPNLPPTPPAVDRELLHRLRHLLDAIAANDAALCHDVQLPRAAYLSDYAHADASRLWDRVVDVSFRKSLARIHRKRRYDELQLLGLETPKPMVLSTKRGKEGWMQPTWRVEGARLLTQLGPRSSSRLAPGRDNTVIVPIGSLVYWRGAWYVERL